MPSWSFQRLGSVTMEDDAYPNVWEGWSDQSASNGFNNDGSLYVDGTGFVQVRDPGVYAWHLKAGWVGLDSGDVAMLYLSGDCFIQEERDRMTVNAELEAAGNAAPGATIYQSVSFSGATYPDGVNGDFPMPMYPSVQAHKVAAAHTVTLAGFYLFATKLGSLS